MGRAVLPTVARVLASPDLYFNVVTNNASNSASKYLSYGIISDIRYDIKSSYKLFSSIPKRNWPIYVTRVSENQRREYLTDETSQQNSPQPTSAPPILTTILMGNGEILPASVIRGTAVRPFSDTVWASITWIDFVRVLASSRLKACRSSHYEDVSRGRRQHWTHTSFVFALLDLHIYHPA